WHPPASPCECKTLLCIRRPFALQERLRITVYFVALVSTMLTRREILATATATTMSAAPSYRILDPHVHVYKRDPRFPYWKGNPSHPQDDKSPEMLIELMKANNVAKTVII